MNNSFICLLNVVWETIYNLTFSELSQTQLWAEQACHQEVNKNGIS